MLDESMDGLRASVHDEMQNIHLELVRQFHIQEHGFAQMLQQLDMRFERYVCHCSTLTELTGWLAGWLSYSYACMCHSV